MTSISFTCGYLIDQQEQTQDSLQLQQQEKMQAIAKLLALIANLAAPIAALEGIPNVSKSEFKRLKGMLEEHDSAKLLPPTQNKLKALLALFQGNSSSNSTTTLSQDKISLHSINNLALNNTTSSMTTN